MRLARRHAALPVGTPLTVAVRRWSAPLPLADVVAGAGFAVEAVAAGVDGTEVRGRRARTLPDFVGPRMRALVCGLNPSLVAADAGFGFAGATNRFWPAALAAGLVRVARDPLSALDADGVGMTDLVKRATPRSAHVTTAEYRAGVERVDRLAEWLRPRVVILVGLEGWRSGADRSAGVGWQARRLGGALVYVMPSTSGANARTPLAELTAHLRVALAV